MRDELAKMGVLQQVMQDKITSDKQESLRTVDKPVIDDALIEEITRRIVEGVHPERIILFGSRGRGDNREDSDLDILVEMESSETRMERKKRVRSFFRDRWRPMDILVYTPAEVAARRNSLISIIPFVEEEGRVLYERTLRAAKRVTDAI
jgi:uncharacterized protein